MHGRACEERKRGRHMWTVSTRGTASVAGDGSSSSSLCTINSFCKDGRKISVGDCALFKPSQDCPPFIGIIRWLTVGKENKLRLGVNWLYRPAEVKLGKGILLEAAPNEIFYSFHKDEIPAASLLHPCKVAFLPKGVELPSGICSFVCRRVYDITNKCLWWLTDQDYINERQEEVDQLIYKTRIEMHATVQSGGRSPKPVNGPTSTSQLKPGSDSVQNSVASFPSQVKGKKRERGEQGSEPVKRERSTKMDDGDSGHYRPEGNLKSEIAKITEKGGLVDSEGVEKLVQLMLPEKNEKKIDLVGRSMFASVVAATDKFDCLSRFVQLRGLPVFDEWLQEVHKGKIGDGSGPKDNDKSVEDFLLILLRALDKLPVNLHALQMCNIGKSVNHLRSHKNLEIQKKARSLVDTWKKRVEAEMDAKSGSNQAVSWPARSRLSEVSHGGNRQTGGSFDVAMKSSVAQLSASKATPVKLVPGEVTAKSASASPGHMKSGPSPASASLNLKDGQPRNGAVSGTSDLPQAAKDEKSSTSSQSHNNSQSCSSDHAKTGVSMKEDLRSSTAGAMAANKNSGGSSRHRKSMNSFPGPALSGIQRESGSSRNSALHKPATEKFSPVDVPVAEGNSHKLIVKIPNRGRSPSQSASGGSFEEPVMNSRASSPVLSEKQDQVERNLKEKGDAYRANITTDVNTESWQSNDFKDLHNASEEGDGSPVATAPEEERCDAGDDSGKIADASKALTSPSGNERKLGKSHEASFSSINALIESCVKYCEANASVAVGDDVGMNLLASVAAEEMSKSDMVLATDSPQRNTPVVEHSCTGSDLRVKSSPGDSIPRDQSQSVDGADGQQDDHGTFGGTLWANNAENKVASSLSQETPLGELNGYLNPSCKDLQLISDACLRSKGKSDDMTTPPSAALPSTASLAKISDSDGSKEVQDEKAVGGVDTHGFQDTKQKAGSSLLTEDKIIDSGEELKTEPVDGSSMCPSLDIDGENSRKMNDGLSSNLWTEQKPPGKIMQPELLKGMDEGVMLPSGSGEDMIGKNVGEVEDENVDEMATGRHVNHIGMQKTEQENNVNKVTAVSSASITDRESEHIEENLKGRHDEQHSGGSGLKASPVHPMQETERHLRPRSSQLPDNVTDETEGCTSAGGDPSCVAGGSEMGAKVEFDLNEGFNADDGKYGESSNLTAPALAAVQLISPLPVPAAKGPFVPPEDLLRSKGELGWKGSAATSAFRPAEPRKILEMPLATAHVSPDSTASKHCRPLLDFDLNVPDERVLDDLASRASTQDIGSVSGPTESRDFVRDEKKCSVLVRSSGGLDLDLNRVDEPIDMSNHSLSNGCRLDVSLPPFKSSSGHLNDVNVPRDFDLNNGPSVEEVSAEPAIFSQHIRSSFPSQSPVSGMRVSNSEMGNFSSWFAAGNTYSAVTIPSILPDRGEQPFPIIATGGPQRMLGPPTGAASFNPDVYRGQVLSSSPAVPFPSTPFQYPVFPFGTSFPLPSATFSGGSTTYVDSSSGGRLCFPAINSQLLGPAGAVPSNFPRPYVVSLPDSANNGGPESSRKWGRQGLDLNAGPGGPDTEGREGISLLPPRQLSIASSQALAEEQARMYHVAGGVLKRKEPEGGWDGYKHSSWQ